MITCSLFSQHNTFCFLQRIFSVRRSCVCRADYSLSYRFIDGRSHRPVCEGSRCHRSVGRVFNGLALRKWADVAQLMRASWFWISDGSATFVTCWHTFYSAGEELLRGLQESHVALDWGFVHFNQLSDCVNIQNGSVTVLWSSGVLSRLAEKCTYTCALIVAARMVWHHRGS